MQEDKNTVVDKLTKKIAKYEPDRRKALTKLQLKEVLAVIIGGGCWKLAVFFYDTHSNLHIFFGLISIIATIVFFITLDNENKEFKGFLKKKCTSFIKKEFGLKSMRGTKFDKQALVDSNLFSNFNELEYDDVIEGCHNKVPYTIAEVNIANQGRKSYIQIFKGVIISFKSHKKINSHTLITTKGDNQIRNYPPAINILLFIFTFGVILPMVLFPFIFAISFKDLLKLIDFSQILLQITTLEVLSSLMFVIIIGFILAAYITQKRKMQDVKLEDNIFEKRFNVYTQDQVEARYLLTPTFMERYKSLETAFGTKKIKCAFFEDQIMFAIPTKDDLFELGSLYTKQSSRKAVGKFYDELKSVQEMIDHFKLNEKTGL